MKIHSKAFEALLAFLASLPSICAVLFTPALPSLAQHFQVTFGEIQQTMVFYLAGYALGQLPYGPLSNRYGRKRVFYLGMSIAILSCILGIIAGSAQCFTLFVIARFFMACGACVGLNVAFTVVGDLYEEKEALKIFAFIMLLSAIIPGIATFTGGILTTHFGWVGCFVFLALFGLVMIFLVNRFLPETNFTQELASLHPKQIFKAYSEELKNLRLVFSALITGCGASMIYLFASSAPFIGINILNLSAQEYGALALIPSFGLLFGSLLTRFLAHRFSLSIILRVGSFFLVLISIIFAILFYLDLINIYTLFSPMFLVDLALSLIFTATAAIAMTRAKNKSIGSSLMSFINLSLTTLSVVVLSLMSIRHPSIVPTTFIFLSLIILLLSFSIIKKLNKQ